MGQIMGRNERGAIYLIADIFLITRFVTFYNEGRRDFDRYRDLSFSVARAAFSPSKQDTVFEYFEQMSNFLESGPFDTDPGPGLVPPTDELTFNGRIWTLARRTFFSNPDSIPDADSPEYQRAIEFYKSRAVGPNFQWSWRNAVIEQDVYRQTIRESDEGFRKAFQQLGLLLANHLLSAIDALVTHRLQQISRGAAVSAVVWYPTGRGLEPRAHLTLKIGF